MCGTNQSPRGVALEMSTNRTVQQQAARVEALYARYERELELLERMADVHFRNQEPAQTRGENYQAVVAVLGKGNGATNLRYKYFAQLNNAAETVITELQGGGIDVETTSVGCTRPAIDGV